MKERGLEDEKGDMLEKKNEGKKKGEERGRVGDRNGEGESEGCGKDGRRGYAERKRKSRGGRQGLLCEGTEETTHNGNKRRRSSWVTGLRCTLTSLSLFSGTACAG